MVKLSLLMYKRSSMSSHASRRHCLRMRIVVDFQVTAVWKGLGVPAEHQVALVKRV